MSPHAPALPPGAPPDASTDASTDASSEASSDASSGAALDAAHQLLQHKPEHEAVLRLLAAGSGRDVVLALLDHGALGPDGLAAAVEHAVAHGDQGMVAAAAPGIAGLDPATAAGLLDVLARVGQHQAVTALAQALLDATATDVPWADGFLVPPSLVVTGTGRCGTGFTASVLEGLGMAVGHELAYTVDRGRRRDGLQVDVSWLAAARLAGHRGAVVHQVRDPLAVVRSLVGIQMFSNAVHGAYRWFMLANVPGLGTDDLAAAVRWYVAWNERIEPHATVRVRLEDLDAAAVVDMLAAVGTTVDPGRVRAAAERVGGPVNARPRAAGIGWADLPDDDATARLRDMARRYGYATD